MKTKYPNNVKETQKHFTCVSTGTRTRTHTHTHTHARTHTHNHHQHQPTTHTHTHTHTHSHTHTRTHAPPPSPLPSTFLIVSTGQRESQFDNFKPLCSLYYVRHELSRTDSERLVTKGQLISDNRCALVSIFSAVLPTTVESVTQRFPTLCID